jgi:hypothetical protein
MTQRELKDIQKNKEFMLHEQDLLEKDREILRLRKLLAEKEQEAKAWTHPRTKLDPEGFLAKSSVLVKAMNKRFDVDVQKYMFAIWRLKFLLKRGLRLKCSLG